MSSVVIHFPSIGMSAVGKPSTYFILGGLGSVRSISSETASLIESPVASLKRSAISNASGERVIVVLRGAGFDSTMPSGVRSGEGCRWGVEGAAVAAMT